MSTPGGSMVTSANITVDNSEDEASNVVDGKKGGKQSGAQDGDDDDAEQVLPEKLNFLLQQSSIYSKIIAEKLARDTAERQKKDARASTKRANKAKRDQDRQKKAGRDTRSGKAVVANGKASNGTLEVSSDVLSSQSEPDSDDDYKVKKQDFEEKPTLQSSNGRQTRNARSRLNAAEAPAKQVAASLGLKDKKSDAAGTRSSPRSKQGRASKANGTKSEAIEIEDSDDAGDAPLDAKQKDEEGEDSASEGDDESDDGEAKSRQPRLVSGATMKSYQLAGMEWLISLYENGLNGILADEMGLGKTLQTISLLAYLRDKGVWGPFIVVCPLSTLANWVNEFERFTPDIPALLYHGSPKEREALREERMSIPVDIVKGKRRQVKATKRGTYHFTTTETFPVVVTSYELVMQDRKYLSKYDWKYLIIDESHRIKNLNCKLIRELMSYKSANRLLLTGTPLQNNLEELWSLLNFLMPEIFDDLDSFKSWFDIDVSSDDTASVQIVTKLHSILKPFLLRRVKREVEKGLPPKKEYLLSAGLTPEQKRLYDAVVKRQIRDFLINRKDLLPDDEKAPFSSDDETIPAKASKKGKGKQGKNGVKRKLGKADTDVDTNVDEQDDDQPKAKRARPSYVEKTEQEFLQALSDGEERQEAEDFEKQRYAHIYNKGETAEDAGRTQTKKVNQLKLQNMVMQLRKVCNHPWLFEWPMDPKTGEYVIDKRIVDTSGKMMLLDRLLSELFRTGHKCLVFSQFTSQIDIIQDWAEEHKKWKTMRIDGLTKQDDRRAQLKAFNEETGPKSTHLFLLSTRSGGVGINLTGADTVILYDSDWNPQMDLQAMDRAHRLGQTKPVLIFRLVTANTIEAKMLERAGAKRKLEALVIGSGKYTTSLEDLQDIFTGNTNRVNKDASGAGLAAQMFAAEMKEVEQGKEIKIVRNAKEAISDEMLKTLLDRSDEAMSRDRGWKAEDQAKAIEVIETAAADDENGDELADFFHNEESAPGSPGSDEME